MFDCHLFLSSKNVNGYCGGVSILVESGPSTPQLNSVVQCRLTIDVINGIENFTSGCIGILEQKLGFSQLFDLRFYDSLYWGESLCSMHFIQCCTHRVSILLNISVKHKVRVELTRAFRPRGFADLPLRPLGYLCEKPFSFVTSWMAKPCSYRGNHPHLCANQCGQFSDSPQGTVPDWKHGDVCYLGSISIDIAVTIICPRNFLVMLYGCHKDSLNT